MKLIGLIGGVSWVSSMEYYRRLNLHIKSKKGGLSSAKLLMYSLNFEDIINHQRNNDIEREFEILKNIIDLLVLAGVSIIAICSNTTSKTLSDLQKNCDVPIISVIDSTITSLVQEKVSKVGLLGTKYTMYQDFYTNALRAKGIKVVVPDIEVGEEINRIIYEELVLNEFHEKSMEYLDKIVRELIYKGCQKIILGCTELPLVSFQDSINQNLIVDCIDCHINEIFLQNHDAL